MRDFNEEWLKDGLEGETVDEFAGRMREQELGQLQARERTEREEKARRARAEMDRVEELRNRERFEAGAIVLGSKLTGVKP